MKTMAEKAVSWMRLLVKVAEHNKKELAEWQGDPPRIATSKIRLLDDHRPTTVSSVSDIMKDGEANLYSLAAWRVAELSREGVSALVVLESTGPDTVQVVVVHWDSHKREHPEDLLGSAS